MKNMTPTDLEFALLCKQAYYKNGGYVTNWKTKESYEDAQGLGAVAYQHERNNVMVIVFRGTDTGKVDNFLKNMITNVQLAFGKEPNTKDAAVKFVADVRSSRIAFERLFDFLLHGGASNELYLAGHSLGGSVAQCVGFEMVKRGKNYRVVTIENPGIGHFVTDDDLKRYKKEFQRFVTLLANPNVINTLHPHIGELRHLSKIKSHSATFIAEGKHKFKQAVNCLTNDVLRLILFLLLVYLLCETFLAKGKTPLSLPKSAEYLSSSLERQGYISPVQVTDSWSTLFSFLTSLSVFIFYNIASEAVTTTSRQHTLDTIINHLTAGKGYPVSYNEMSHWPSQKQYLVSHLKHASQWLNPFKHASFCSFNRLDEIEDERIQNLDGYTVRKIVSS